MDDSQHSASSDTTVSSSSETEEHYAHRRPSSLRRAWILLSLAMVGSLVLVACPQKRSPMPGQGQAVEPIRAVWVTRWDFKSERDIVRVMENCRQAGFNTVLFQVRGNGTVLYRSKIEPWAKDLGGRDPGFDPLSVACTEAHRRGMKIQAWVNVIPGWRGKKPPENPNQLYNKHRDWFWRDARGQFQPLGWYVSVNPCYPEVRSYLVSLMEEIVRNYPVDGLHMDYIRFPNEYNSSYPKGTSVPDYPRDPRTLALFKKRTGSTPESSPRNWNTWRTEQITRLVYDIRTMVKRHKPVMTLTAAVGSVPREAKKHHFQDSVKWLESGLVDAVFPMNYASDMATFNDRLNGWKGYGKSKPVVTGIMFDKRDPDLVMSQVDHSIRATGHFAAFAYNSLFERTNSAGQPSTDSQSKNRSDLRLSLIPRIRAMGRK